MTKTENIYAASQKFYGETGLKPNLVLMHPKLYRELVHDMSPGLAQELAQNRNLFGMKVEITADREEDRVSVVFDPNPSPAQSPDTES